MALYKRDYIYEKAKDVIKNLDSEGDNFYIKYYITEKEKQISKDQEQLKKYREFFKMLNSLLPKSNVIFG